LLTGEWNGYYRDFGSVQQLAKAYRDSFVYDGAYSPFRQRRHGNPARDLPGKQFVVCAQNHDQVGNRMLGERLSQLVSFDSLKLAAGAVLLTPNLPLLFMGEEYGETAPFQYFTSHGDEHLIEAVRRGRREEFDAFAWQGHPPDPQAEQTFLRCKLHPLWGQVSNLPRAPDRLETGSHDPAAAQSKHERGRVLREFYRELIRLRRTQPALAQLSKEHLEAVPFEQERVLFLRRWWHADEVFFVLHFGDAPVTLALPIPAGRWRKVLDASEPRWLGSGSLSPSDLSSAEGVSLSLGARSVVVFQRAEPE
jgi:maltooligosyltrehalose trehalohydrolase